MNSNYLPVKQKGKTWCWKHPLFRETGAALAFLLASILLNAGEAMTTLPEWDLREQGQRIYVKSIEPSFLISQERQLSQIYFHSIEPISK